MIKKFREYRKFNSDSDSESDEMDVPRDNTHPEPNRNNSKFP